MVIFIKVKSTKNNKISITQIKKSAFKYLGFFLRKRYKEQWQVRYLAKLNLNSKILILSKILIGIIP